MIEERLLAIDSRSPARSRRLRRGIRPRPHGDAARELATDAPPTPSATTRSCTSGRAAVEDRRVLQIRRAKLNRPLQRHDREVVLVRGRTLPACESPNASTRDERARAFQFP
jgi:hypothetical protein